MVPFTGVTLSSTMPSASTRHVSPFSQLRPETVLTLDAYAVPVLQSMKVPSTPCSNTSAVVPFKLRWIRKKTFCTIAPTFWNVPCVCQSVQPCTLASLRVLYTPQVPFGNGFGFTIELTFALTPLQTKTRLISSTVEPFQAAMSCTL